MLKPFAEVQQDAGKITDLAAKIKTAAANEQEAVSRIEKDKTRSGSWKLEQIAAIRKESKVADMLAELKARFEELKPYKETWTDPYYALSSARILGGPGDAALEAAEATVRTNYRAELALMPRLAAKLTVAEAASRRDWGRVFQGVLALGTEGVPFALDQLPLPSIEAAQDLFFRVEVAFRSAAIGAEELMGIRNSSQTIALGLLQQEYDRQKLARQKGWVLNLDERKELGFDKPQTLQEKMNPKPLNITLTERQTGANYKSGSRFEAIQPGELPE